MNLLSAATTQTSIHFHYTAGLIPVLIAATVFGASAVDAARPGRRACVRRALRRLELPARPGADLALLPGRRAAAGARGAR